MCSITGNFLIHWWGRKAKKEKVCFVQEEIVTPMATSEILTDYTH